MLPTAQVINLSQERWSKMQQKLQDWRLNAVRFPAVDGTTLTTADIRGYILGRRLNAGEKGCLLSHVNIWKRMVAERLPLALILEDDIITHLEVDHLHQSLYAALEEKWDVFFLGKCFADCATLRLVRDNIYQVYSTYCLHAYLLTLRGAMLLLARTPFSRAIDVEVSSALEDGSLVGYAYHPSIFVQDTANNPSTLRSLQASITNSTECRQRAYFPYKMLWLVVIMGAIIALLWKVRRQNIRV